MANLSYQSCIGISIRNVEKAALTSLLRAVFNLNSALLPAPVGEPPQKIVKLGLYKRVFFNHRALNNFGLRIKLSI